MTRVLTTIVVVCVGLVTVVIILFAGGVEEENKCMASGSGDATAGPGGPPANADGFSEPIKDASQHLSSGFRPPDRPDHEGQDIAVPEGSPIFAFADGTVVAHGEATGFGQWIILAHQIDGQRVDTVYGHMWPQGNNYVHVGDQVKSGQHIADVGTNGFSTGPHLHFEVWIGGHRDITHGTAVDPGPWIAKATSGGGTSDDKGSDNKAQGGDAATTPDAGDSATAVVARGADTTSPDIDLTAKSSNTRLVVLGDSTTAGPVAQMLPGKVTSTTTYTTVDVDAIGGSALREVEGTTGTTGIGRLKAQMGKGPADVLIAMGVNDVANIVSGSGGGQGAVEDRIDEVMGIVGDQATVFWPRVAVGSAAAYPYDKASVGIWNAGLEAAAKRHRNLVVVPWAPPDSAFQPDGIHYTTDGYTQRADMMASAVANGSGTRASSDPAKELPDSDKIASKDHLQIDTIRVARAVAAKFPAVQTIGGWRPVDRFPDHPSGRAADIMIPNYDSAEGKKLGDDIKAYLFANKDFFHIEYMIWRNVYIPSEGAESPYTGGDGTPTGDHMDHVHVTTEGHGFPGPDEKYFAPDGGSASPGSNEDCVTPASASGVDVALNEAEIPEELRKWITLGGRKCQEVPAPLLAGLIYHESAGFQAQAVSQSGAQGYGQFMPGTWAGMGAKVDDNGEVSGPPGSGSPSDPADATMAAARYLCQIAADQREAIASGQLTGDTRTLMLAGYNAGPGAVQQFGGVPPYAETQKYVVIVPQEAKRFEGAV